MKKIYAPWPHSRGTQGTSCSGPKAYRILPAEKEHSYAPAGLDLGASFNGMFLPSKKERLAFDARFQSSAFRVGFVMRTVCLLGCYVGAVGWENSFCSFGKAYRWRRIEDQMNWCVVDRQTLKFPVPPQSLRRPPTYVIGTRSGGFTFQVQQGRFKTNLLLPRHGQLSPHRAWRSSGSNFNP